MGKISISWIVIANACFHLKRSFRWVKKDETKGSFRPEAVVQCASTWKTVHIGALLAVDRFSSPPP